MITAFLDSCNIFTSYESKIISTFKGNHLYYWILFIKDLLHFMLD